jgi:hypothetical protein
VSPLITAIVPQLRQAGAPERGATFQVFRNI